MEELVSKKKLITIVGAGYVGMSLSVLLGKDNNHVKILEIDENPDFSEILSQRRPHSEGMGDLLHWWKFDSKSQKIDTYEVLIPAHKGQDISGNFWIFDGVSSTLHLNQ